MRLKSEGVQVRTTGLCDTPIALAIERESQCVALRGVPHLLLESDEIDPAIGAFSR